LLLYLAEFHHRYNHRTTSDGERMVVGMKKATGKLLSYKPLTKKRAAEAQREFQFDAPHQFFLARENCVLLCLWQSIEAPVAKLAPVALELEQVQPGFKRFREYG
jgi:hypothetical protein